MNRKTIIIFLIIYLLPANFMFAQEMRKIFGDMPSDLFLLADSIQKQDLMDLFLEGQNPYIKNNFNDTVSLKDFSDDYLLLSIGQSTTEIILLPLVNDSKIICLIKTVCSPVCDSKIYFYTTEWKSLDSGLFINPVDYTEFLIKNIDTTDIEFVNASRMLDMNLMSFSYDKTKGVLNQNYETPKYLSLNDYKKIKPFLREDPVTFSWVKTSFRKN